MNDSKYYEAYDQRYLTAHKQGISWFSSVYSPIVLATIEKYRIHPSMKLLELGCGEGRDAVALLKDGFDLLATDISPEAIRYCRQLLPEKADHFAILDCLNGHLQAKFDFIYAVAVIHMLVLQEDRDQFYRFIRDHLSQSGISLICTMGDGQMQVESDISKAFSLQERDCRGQKMMVAGTSCKMVAKDDFLQEIQKSGLRILEFGHTSVPGEFTEMMYAVVQLG